MHLGRSSDDTTAATLSGHVCLMKLHDTTDITPHSLLCTVFEVHTISISFLLELHGLYSSQNIIARLTEVTHLR